jgi:hypothetical protein
MRPRTALSLVAAAVLALAAAAAAAPPPVDRAALLERYSPVLFFGADEDWSPIPVEKFLDDAKVERQSPTGAWTAYADTFPTSTTGCTVKACYRLNLPCSLRSGDACYHTRAPSISDWTRGTAYGRVLDVPVGTPSPPGVTEPVRYLVRYWLFYYYDDWHSPRRRLWQTHEGDWESISVGLSAAQVPLFAAYSEHCSGAVRIWSSVRRRGTHPVAYVAAGSHANYFGNKTVPTKFVECLKKTAAGSIVRRAEFLAKLAEDRVVDRTGTAHELSGDALEIDELPTTLPEWARFPGRWSEGELVWAGGKPTRFTRLQTGAGPATPRWNATAISALWHTGTS